MKQNIEARKDFFNIAEASQLLEVHRNTVSNMIDDGRIETCIVGKRNMIHSSELNRIKNGRISEHSTVEVDVKIAIKIQELQELLTERSNIGRMTKEEFLNGLALLKKNDRKNK